MAIINFLFGSRLPSGFSLSGVVEFDADLTIEENHERAADVTEHPVESGAVVSDHVILSPERLRVSGFVSDAGVAVFGAQPGRTQGAFETLDSAWRARDLVQVVTGYKTYRDMVITRLDMPRNRPESMQFNIEMQHVIIVDSQTAQLAAGEPSSPAVANATGSRTDAGRQPTGTAGDATASAAERAQTRSTLAGFF
jgi:hypothetical protein